MAIEIEIKLRLHQDLPEVRKQLRGLGFQVTKVRSLESNILFDNLKRTLRKNGKLVRLRHVRSQSLFTFKGPSGESKYKKRHELEVNLPNGALLEDILNQMGYHPVFRYEKFRTEYSKRFCDAIVLLDETPIGNFLEIEGTPRCIDKTAEQLGFSSRDYIARSYFYLYSALCRERRVNPQDMLFPISR